MAIWPTASAASTIGGRSTIVCVHMKGWIWTRLPAEPARVFRAARADCVRSRRLRSQGPARRRRVLQERRVACGQGVLSTTGRPAAHGTRWPVGRLLLPQGRRVDRSDQRDRRVSPPQTATLRQYPKSLLFWNRARLLDSAQQPNISAPTLPTKKRNSPQVRNCRPDNELKRFHPTSLATRMCVPRLPGLTRINALRC